jgi:hypothetical protein
MPELGNLVEAVAGAFFGALGAYVAIRSDLADHKARIKIVEIRTGEAHDRIDSILMERRK